MKGRHSTNANPGVTVPIGARITPAESGPVNIDVERFDPVHGWQFFHRYSLHVSGGVTTVSFRPPSMGRWRARASFLGTRGASPSVSGWAQLTVATPLPA